MILFSPDISTHFINPGRLFYRTLHLFDLGFLEWKVDIDILFSLTEEFVDGMSLRVQHI